MQSNLQLPWGQILLCRNISGLGKEGQILVLYSWGAKRKVSAFDRKQISFDQPTVRGGRKGFAFHLGRFE